MLKDARLLAGELEATEETDTEQDEENGYLSDTSLVET
jgi:hypothetical protein